MATFFGTDGIRGITNSSLSHEIAFKCGNSLTMLKDKPKVVICKDTRVSGDVVLYAMATGIMCGGGKVINCGVLPTAGLAYITRLYNADYGVVISASHNPFEYNGIKIFSASGHKLNEEQEEGVEECFNRINLKTGKEIGTIIQDENAKNLYADYLAGTVNISLKGIKVALDCACGASYSIAPEVFERLGCTVVKNHTDITKGTINDNCGSLFPDTISKETVESGADIGFAFDGDSDRVIASDGSGKIADGDCLIYVLAKYMKEKGRLSGNTVVGTAHTNMGIQKALSDNGINLLRTDIGDKYVREAMTVKNLMLGGEQSGHIIIGDLSTTGDGILSAIQICSVIKESGKKISELNDATLYPQVNVNVPVKDKFLIINSERLQGAIDECREKLSGRGRVMVRASGTEPKIRVMAECENYALAKSTADLLVELVKEIAVSTAM